MGEVCRVRSSDLRSEAKLRNPTNRTRTFCAKSVLVLFRPGNDSNQFGGRALQAL